MNDLEAAYDAALRAWVAKPDEETLSVAYELGRVALDSGLGVLDLLAIHRAALRAVLAEDARAFDAAADFFREALSPFEMAFRGYADANAQLRDMNHALVREREAVLAANRELEAFSYSVSHDLRAPLRAIDGFSRIVEEDAAERLTEDDRRHLARVRQGVAHMAELIGDLLSLSRVARAEMVRARVDLAAIATRIVERLRESEPGREVAVRIEAPLLVDGDPGLLTIALENLLGNAWKFTSKRPKASIEIGRKRDAERVVYYVRDDGAGFDMTYAAKLFGAFQRLHSANDFEGTGIGLATVQRIVLRHGGRVWAEGAPGAGATFFFTLGESTAA